MHARHPVFTNASTEAICALVVGARLPMSIISLMHLFKMLLLPAPQVFFVLFSVHSF